MNDKQIFLAYILDENEFGTQMLKYEFEHPIVEYWGEPDEQQKLKDYFKQHHYTRQEPLAVEASQVIDYMPYKAPPSPNLEFPVECDHEDCATFRYCSLPPEERRRRGDKPNQPSATDIRSEVSNA